MKIEEVYSKAELNAMFDCAELVLARYIEGAKKGLPTNMPSAKVYSLLFENLLRIFAKQQVVNYTDMVVFATILATLDYHGTSSYKSASERRKHFQCEIEDFPYDPELLFKRLSASRSKLLKKNVLARTFQATITVSDVSSGSSTAETGQKTQKVRVSFRIPRGVLLDLLENKVREELPGYKI